MNVTGEVKLNTFIETNGILARPLLLLFLVLSSISNATAQNYLPVARFFGVNDGLPHRQVNSIIQDRQGFIWVATEAGVARFDGLRFKTLNKADNGLSNDQVRWMVEDATGNIWLFANAFGDYFHTISVDVLNPVSGEIKSLQDYTKEKSPVPFENLHPIAVRANADAGKVKRGTLFFGTRNPGGWVSWHPDHGWKRVIAPDMNRLELLCCTPQQGVVGVSTYSGLYYDHVELDSNGKIVRTFRGQDGNGLMRVFGNAQHPERYFAQEVNRTNGEMIFWEIKPGADKTRLNLPVPKLRSSFSERLLLLETESGEVWVNEHDVFNRKGESLLDLLGQFPAINNKYLSVFLRDRNGSIWLGTGFGLEQIEIRKDHFRRFMYFKDASDGNGIPCRGIFQSGSKLWVNTEGSNEGLKGIDITNGKLFYNQKASTSYGLMIDHSGQMWSGAVTKLSLNGILARLDPVSGKVQRTYNLNPAVIWTIFEARPNQLWCGTSQGLAIFNTQTEQVSYQQSPGYPELANANIVYIGRDRSGVTWLCSNTGFYKMTEDGQVAGRYWTGGKGEYQFPFDDFYHFYQDAAGVFWLGTAGGGLLRWDTKTGEKRLLSRNNGLLNNFIYAVYEDDYNHLWLPTNLGIAQFDKKTLTVRRTWGPADGVAHNEFNRTSHFKGLDGTLYFGGLNGVTAFHPKDFYTSSEKGTAGKNLALCDFKLFSGTSESLENRTADLINTGKITIQPSDRYFQLDFALLDYTLPKKVTYAYKIEDISADWNILPEAQLHLSGLPYGNHTLTIKAVSADGTKADNELRYQLSVLRPIYLRWWFLVLAAAALSWGIFLLYRFQLNRQLKDKETQRLQQLDVFKTRFFTNISHEFRTPLTVILGMVESLKNDTGERREKSAEMVRRNSRQLLSLVNQLLDLSRVESGKLQLAPSNGDLVSYLRFQLESFHSYAQSRGIDLHFRTEISGLPMAFDHDKIQTILTNLISNALKFTPEGGQIALDLKTSPSKMSNDPDQVILELSDTGVGIPEDQLDRIFDRFYQVDDSTTRKSEGSGIGLALVQELIKLMQGKIVAHSTQGKGTTFQITLPYAAPLAQLQTYTANTSDLPGFAIPVTPSIVEVQPIDDDQRPQVLVVEDNADVRFYITECVREVYRVVLAENGDEGINRAIELVPDIIISDVMMPEKDGYTLCDTLKNDERTSHIPIILLTAKADSASRIAGLRRGADAYLAKPFNVEELLANLHMMVERQKRMLAFFSKTAEKPSEIQVSVQHADLEIEHAFIRKVRAIIEKNFTEENFALPQLCGELNMSRSQLYRKLKALVDVPPSDYIRTYRLQKAKSLLETDDLTVSEVAWQVGYKDVSHFSRSFHDQFGFPPGARNN